MRILTTVTVACAALVLAACTGPEATPTPVTPAGPTSTASTEPPTPASSTPSAPDTSEPPSPAVSDGAVRPLIHPDPRRGVTHCRVVEETPQTLRDLGYTRITLVLRAARRTDAPARRPRRTRRTAGHLRVVPAPEV